MYMHMIRKQDTKVIIKKQLKTKIYNYMFSRIVVKVNLKQTIIVENSLTNI